VRIAAGPRKRIRQKYLNASERLSDNSIDSQTPGEAPQPLTLNHPVSNPGRLSGRGSLLCVRFSFPCIALRSVDHDSERRRFSMEPVRRRPIASTVGFERVTALRWRAGVQAGVPHPARSRLRALNSQ
jgi:hypothetical protein